MRSWALLVVVALAGCKHDDGMPTGTATIHSGTPEGPKVTNITAATQATERAGAWAQMGDELARAFCKHDEECALGEAEPRLLREEVCFNDARGGARASLSQWPCEPMKARAGFDACLAAIRDADCTARVGEGALIPACSAAEICRRSDVSP
jgi:hypothetical protein